MLRGFQHNRLGGVKVFKLLGLGGLCLKASPIHANCAPVRFASGSSFARVFVFEWVFVFRVCLRFSSGFSFSIRPVRSGVVPGLTYDRLIGKKKKKNPKSYPASSLSIKAKFERCP